MEPAAFAATFEALAVLLLALIPGAIYTWAFERIAGRWGIGLSDRLYRFVGISAFYQVLIAPATYNIWLGYIRKSAPHRFQFPLWMWAAIFGYVALPAAIGTVLALSFKGGRGWARAIVGATAPPTAWDAMFSGAPASAYVLMRLKSGKWVGGRFDDGSYVGGYPEPADLYLITELAIDQDREDFIRDDAGDPVPQGGYGLLVRWEEVEYLEVTS